MKIAKRARYRIGGSLLTALAIAGGLIISLDSNTNATRAGSAGSTLVSDNSKLAHLTPPEHAFVNGIILDSLSNSRVMPTAAVAVSPAPALSTFGRTVSAVKKASPQALRRPNASTAAAAGAQRLENFFTGQQLAAEQKKFQTTITNDVAAQETSGQYPILDMGHGVSGIEIDRIAKSGTTMAISGKAVYWGVMGQVQPSGSIAWAEPMNTVLLDARITQVSGTWKIASLSWSFTPDSQP